jgi:hypothetical protein
MRRVCKHWGSHVPYLNTVQIATPFVGATLSPPASLFLLSRASKTFTVGAAKGRTAPNRKETVPPDPRNPRTWPPTISAAEIEKLVKPVLRKGVSPPYKLLQFIVKAGDFDTMEKIPQAESSTNAMQSSRCAEVFG